MNLRSPLELTVAGLVILVGLLIGGMFALLTRGTTQQTAQSVAVTSTTSTTRPVHRASRRASAAPATTAPTVAPTAAPTTAPTAAPAVPPTAVAPAVATAAGVWRIEEANVHVGTIVWSGSGAAAGAGNAIALDVHKESVAGHGVSACERRTTLHVVLSAGAAAQTVPYREVNCSGAASAGEMRVSTFSSDGRTFSGSFWSDGSKLGDFTAART
jgi:hypothetical protein